MADETEGGAPRQLEQTTRMGIKMCPVAFCPIASRLTLRTIQTNELSQPVEIPAGGLLLLIPEPDSWEIMKAFGFMPPVGLVGAGKIAPLSPNKH